MSKQSEIQHLLFPWVSVKNLASHALGLALRQLAPDWQRQHGSRPVLAETYTDPERHRGTCYKAANWQRVGRTQGSPAQGAGRRRRVLNTLLVVLFVFRLVFAPDRQGYAVTLAELWAQCRRLGLGRFAVDGSKLNLPRPLVRDGYRQPAEAAHYPQGLLSCLFQLRARLPVDFGLHAVFAAFCCRVRLVKYTAGTSTYVLATTLLDRSRYRVADLSDLYHARWGIEELYKISKQMLTVEQFHGQSELLVQQELSAHFSRVIAMTRLFTNHSEGGYRSDPGKPALQANFRNGLRTVGRYLEGLFLYYAATLDATLREILDSIAPCRQRRRPNRSYPRVSRKPASKWRSRKPTPTATPA